jgi:hypothetical protein
MSTFIYCIVASYTFTKIIFHAHGSFYSATGLSFQYLLDQDVLDILRTNQRDQRGWPVLTVESEMNDDSKSTNERGPWLVGTLGSSYRYKRLFPALAALVSPVLNIFPRRTVHCFILCVSIPSNSNLGRQSCRDACLWRYGTGTPYFAAEHFFPDILRRTLCIRTCTCTIVLNSILHI